jgi:hypothetical protein
MYLWNEIFRLKTKGNGDVFVNVYWGDEKGTFKLREKRTFENYH